ncbi:MAG TPA: CBS domain-containing protein [Candidatus Bathyarchaeia archaeon]|nr:CBS domain-containing protein [Candidatus Bathyarchaeia archaeon]
MQASYLMTKAEEVVTVDPHAKLTDVARILFEKKFTGLPVLEKGKVVGLITERDLLTRDPSFEIHIPSLITILSDFKVIEKLSEKQKDELKQIFSVEARDIMETDYSFVSADAPLTEVMKIMTEKHANPILVVDGSGGLEGLISRADILKFVGRFNELELNFISSGAVANP